MQESGTTSVCKLWVIWSMTKEHNVDYAEIPESVPNKLASKSKTAQSSQLSSSQNNWLYQKV